MKGEAWPTDRPGDDLGEVARRRERTGPHDRARDGPRPPLLAVLRDDPDELRLRPLVHEVGGGERAARVHAHVERALALEGEPALGCVQLERADAEVEQHRVGPVPSLLAEDRRGVGEGRLAQLDAVRVATQALARRREGPGIAIEPDELSAGRGAEQGRRVSAEPDGRVDEMGTRSGAQPLHHFPHHHRHVGCAHRPGALLVLRPWWSVQRATPGHSARRPHRPVPPPPCGGLQSPNHSSSSARSSGLSSTKCSSFSKTSCHVSVFQMRNLSMSPANIAARPRRAYLRRSSGMRMRPWPSS